ncbi:MAG: transposase [Planctomycetota bacterium]
MEREVWSILMTALRDASRARRDPNHHTHSTAMVVRVYLWAVLHDRPVSWACQRSAWDDRTRPDRLPSQPTMSRRLRTLAVASVLDALTRRLRGKLDLERLVVHRIDGKPMGVARHTRDPQAARGYGAGQFQWGYKLHLVDGGRAMPEAWAVTPMNASESRVARQLVPRLRGQGYVLGDANYDDQELYALCQGKGLRFLAPRRRPRTGLNKAGACHPERLRAIGTLESAGVGGGSFGRTMMRIRRQIETTLGRWTTHALGFKGLPAWARGLRRVRQWVHAKLLINAAYQHATERADE